MATVRGQSLSPILVTEEGGGMRMTAPIQESTVSMTPIAQHDPCPQDPNNCLLGSFSKGIVAEELMGKLFFLVASGAVEVWSRVGGLESQWTVSKAVRKPKGPGGHAGRSKLQE